MVSSGLFPKRVVFMIVEWRRNVQEAFESNQVPQRRHSIVQYDIHPTSVYRVDTFPPDADRSEMRVEKGQVQRAKSVRAPGKIDHRTAGEVDTFDAHTRQVIQGIQQPLYIAPVSQLGSCQVVFPCGAIYVVVAWVAVHETVEHECIEWETPIVR